MPKKTITLQTRYWHFSQNNSGGYFTIDDNAGLGPSVWIEATSMRDAINRARDIGIYFDGVASGTDCPCCGDRWYEPWREDEGKEAPEITQPTGQGAFKEGDFMWHNAVYIHEVDGTIKRVRKVPVTELKRIE